MVLLGDKFGGNLDMTGHGHIGGEKVLCEKFYISQKKQKEKKRFTVIGLKKLLGETICCIVIIEGKD